MFSAVSCLVSQVTSLRTVTTVTKGWAATAAAAAAAWGGATVTTVSTNSLGVGPVLIGCRDPDVDLSIPFSCQVTRAAWATVTMATAEAPWAGGGACKRWGGRPEKQTLVLFGIKFDMKQPLVICFTLGWGFFFTLVWLNICEKFSV